MKKVLFTAIVVLLVAAFGVSAFMVGNYLIDGKKQAERNEELSEIVANAQTETTAVPETTEAAETQESTEATQETTEATQPTEAGGILPGYKIGLANVATVFALYTLGWPYAILVSVLRVLLTFLLFPKIDAFMLSLAGAVLALVAMILIKKFCNFSPILVSVAGGLAHNVGQIIVACFLVKNTVIAATIIPLFFIGTVTGVLIGIISGIIIKRLKKFL